MSDKKSNTNLKLTFKYEYIDKKKLKEINEERKESNLKSVGLAGLIGYVYDEIKVVGQAAKVFATNFKEEMKLMKEHGYLTRGEAIKNHFKVFKNEIKNENSIIGFSNDGILYSSKSKIMAKKTRELKKYQKEDDFIYHRSYFNFSHEQSEKLKGMYSQEEMFNIMKTHLDIYLKENNFDTNNLKFMAAFHTNKKHLHLHFDFWEKDRKRKRVPLNVENQREKLIKNILLDLDPDLRIEYEKSITKLNIQKEMSIDKFDLEYNDFIIKVFKDIKYSKYGNFKKEDSKRKDIVQKFIEKQTEKLYKENYESILISHRDINENMYGNDRALVIYEREKNKVINKLNNDVYNYYKNFAQINYEEEIIEEKKTNVNFQNSYINFENLRNKSIEELTEELKSKITNIEISDVAISGMYYLLNKKQHFNKDAYEYNNNYFNKALPFIIDKPNYIPLLDELENETKEIKLDYAQKEKLKEIKDSNVFDKTIIKKAYNNNFNDKQIDTLINISNNIKNKNIINEFNAIKSLNEIYKDNKDKLDQVVDYEKELILYKEKEQINKNLMYELKKEQYKLKQMKYYIENNKKYLKKQRKQKALSITKIQNTKHKKIAQSKYIEELISEYE